ncbi:MAG: hypothetical protein Ct9H90mP2_09710 [Dehalococcoidia bacterium]|nr:MAG: hypothetical protein Ct9H90mP2_09710 [Dehalococcoidia bacterium]
MFASITLSRNLVVNLIIFANLSQSMEFSFSDSITNFPTSIEPKLHDSFGSKGCSPHGFVAVILPTCQTRAIPISLRLKNHPGSPFDQAP